MPDSALWALVGSIALLAFGLVLKYAGLSHRFQRSENEAHSLRTEIDSLKKTHDKEISDIKEFHGRKAEEFTKEIDRLTHNDDSLPNLSDKDIEILSFVADSKMIGGVYLSIDRPSLCQKTKLSNQQLQYHLDRLSSADCLNYNLEGGICGITPKGRELLHEKDLLP